MLHPTRFVRAAVAASVIAGAAGAVAVAPVSPPPAAADGSAAAAPAPRPALPPLSWAPPALTSPETVLVSETNHSLNLDPAKDYIIKMPGTPLRVGGGLTISGGRNVVLIGGTIEAPGDPNVVAKPGDLSRRALYLKGQTGTIHIEGLYFKGPGLTEGINLDQRLGAVVQLQNLRMDTLEGSYSGHHADLVQTWAGPAELRIDGLTGSTGYQGFFLLPNQHFKGDAPRKFDFRRIDITGTDRSAYLLWGPGGSPFPVSVRDVWVRPNPKKSQARDQFLWPKPSTGDHTWDGVRVGTPPGGEFVPAGAIGIGYVSPGYQKPGEGVSGAGKP